MNQQRFNGAKPLQRICFPLIPSLLVYIFSSSSGPYRSQLPNRELWQGANEDILSGRTMRTCCPLGSASVSHSPRRLFLPQPLMWSIRLGTHRHINQTNVYVSVCEWKSRCKWQPLAFLQDQCLYFSHLLFATRNEKTMSSFVRRL